MQSKWNDVERCSCYGYVIYWCLSHHCRVQEGGKLDEGLQVYAQESSSHDAWWITREALWDFWFESSYKRYFVTKLIKLNSSGVCWYNTCEMLKGMSPQRQTLNVVGEDKEWQDHMSVQCHLTSITCISRYATPLTVRNVLILTHCTLRTLKRSPVTFYLFSNRFLCWIRPHCQFSMPRLRKKRPNLRLYQCYQRFQWTHSNCLKSRSALQFLGWQDLPQSPSCAYTCPCLGELLSG